MQNTGKTIIIIWIILIFVGIVIWSFGDKLNWLGNLPGDIRVKKGNFSFYMPLTSMILLSIIVSLIIWIIRKFI